MKLRLDRRALNIALLVAALAALAILVVRGGDARGVEVLHLEPRSGIDEIRVDVSGAVLRPSVVTVAPGDRVIDAIALAGGLAPDADPAALNLARRVVDADRVTVPRIGRPRDRWTSTRRARRSWRRCPASALSTPRASRGRAPTRGASTPPMSSSNAR